FVPLRTLSSTSMPTTDIYTLSLHDALPISGTKRFLILQSFEAGPGFHHGTSPAGIDQANGYALRRMDRPAEKIAYGRKISHGFRTALLPLSGYVFLRNRRGGSFNGK